MIDIYIYRIIVLNYHGGTSDFANAQYLLTVITDDKITVSSLTREWTGGFLSWKSTVDIPPAKKPTAGKYASNNITFSAHRGQRRKYFIWETFFLAREKE